MKRKDTSAELARLRHELGAVKLDAYVVPSSDAHMSEYIADCDCRREFISGFTGSAGTAVVTLADAALWTDGRYFTQAAAELDDNWVLMKAGNAETPSRAEWLRGVLPASGGGRVGVDPRLLSASAFAELKTSLSAGGRDDLELVAFENENLIDKVWGAARPAPPASKVFVHGEKYAGRSVSDKLEATRAQMKTYKAGLLVLTALDEVAWHFNLRGADIMCNPVFFAYAVISAQGEAVLFADASRFAPEVAPHLATAGVTVRPYVDFFQYINANAAQLAGGGRVWHGPTCSQAVVSTLSHMSLLENLTPPQTAKAVKCETELQGARAAHVRDAVALTEFFYWLETQFAEDPSRRDITEVSAAKKLDQLRAQQADFVSLSFPTISGSGSNAAIIHYHAMPDSCAPLSVDNIYLCDSGGQYLDGTTDVTRTVHFGQPTERERVCFTHVLKGHIALDRAVFPSGTYGRSLDTLARQYLWRAGLNYNHGTGHGVGSFLNVHEGPISIGFQARASVAALQPGNIVSNEPGYYETGAFGIRIENLVEVVEAKCEDNFENRGFYTMQPLTLFPIQAKLIVPDMLSPEETAWLDDYHAKTRLVVGAELQAQGRGAAYEWLIAQTRPLADMVE